MPNADLPVPSPGNSDLKDLVRKAQEGDREAQEKLCGWIYAFALHCLRRSGRVDAEDLAQDSTLRVFLNLHEYCGMEGSFRSWVYRIAFNVFIDQCRRDRRFREYVDATFRPDDSMRSDVKWEIRMRELMDGLDPDTRAIFHLSFMEGMAADEVPQTLGIRLAV